jgi:hypothetical protein
MSNKTSSNPIASIFFLLSAYFAYHLVFSGLPFWLGIGAVSFCMIIGSVVLSFHDSSTQNFRDERAYDIYKTLSQDGNALIIPKYFLYIRPFSTTGELSTQNSDRVKMGGAEFMLPRGYQKPSFDIEERLANSLSGEATLVGLGKPGEALGAGRLPTEDSEWKKIVSAFMEHANHIFVVPGDQAGTMWEISRIVEFGYLSKTSFIFPPKSENIGGKFNWKSHFNNISDVFAENGLSIPELNENGVIFEYSLERRIRKLSEIPLATAKDSDLDKLMLKIIE